MDGNDDDFCVNAEVLYTRLLIQATFALPGNHMWFTVINVANNVRETRS